MLFQQRGLRLLEFVEVARGEHQPRGLVAGEAAGDGQTQAARASGDEHDGADTGLREAAALVARADGKDGGSSHTYSECGTGHCDGGDGAGNHGSAGEERWMNTAHMRIMMPDGR